MGFNRTYIGRKMDLGLFKGNDIINYTLGVTNKDGTAYSFTGYTDINLKVYSDEDRTNVLKTIATGSFSIAANVITINVDYSVALDLNVGDYFYELTYEDATSRPITVIYGDFKIV